ncbi:hypothetical protein [Flavobacterium sp. ENC]|uniref:hypothetical protein n=1 Tax=Flavobacterium sp. ENC TaxID=2897330 RepID=UPI001E2BD83F|nr:hypothetical protein [Flavobacterium sp. ENC]MCD0463901.1 hypothetical protein [Flavobacterium sp. ENC]
MSEQSLLEISNSFGKKISTSLILALEFSALLLLLGNGGNIPWLPPVLVFSMIGISLVSALLFPLLWHFSERKKTQNSIKIYGFMYAAIRYCIAFSIIAFGWKKFYGLQFIVPAEISNRPMNQQSGEWLTWFYFGYSHAYGILIASIQIIGGCLLLFKRTVLPGAVILFSVLFNLTLINVFYQMNAGALLESLLLTIGVLYLMLLDYKKIIIFFLKTNSELPSVNLKSVVVKNIIRFSVIVLSLLYTIYLKNLIK